MPKIKTVHGIESRRVVSPKEWLVARKKLLVKEMAGNDGGHDASLGVGMMNPLVIVGVAIIIAAEKLLPPPEFVARLAGVAAIILGVITTLHKLNQ